LKEGEKTIQFLNLISNILYIKGHREDFFITCPSIHPSIHQEDEEENEVTVAVVVTR
jgi:hypothetical protein